MASDETYTATVVQHLDDLEVQQRYLANLARGTIEDCQAVGDEDGVKIAQLDLSLAELCLGRIRAHTERAILENAPRMAPSGQE